MKRDEVRDNFPECVKVADEFKRQFGQIRLLYVKENGQEMGRKLPEGVKIGKIDGDFFGEVERCQKAKKS